MNRIATFVLACSMSLAFAPGALAHHSAAAFDTRQEVKATGTITEFTFRNPHVYMTVLPYAYDHVKVAPKVPVVHIDNLDGKAK